MRSEWFNNDHVPTILITGKNGQVGWELQRSLSPVGKVIAVDRAQLNLANPENIRSVINKIQPDIIVNAAAYTAVDKAEDEQELAFQVNAIAPKIIAEQAKKINALLIHFSTDYVFDGSKKSPYTETDTPAPINVYGSSKLAGEQAIQGSGCQYLILRTSWVFASRAQNFLLSMLRLAKERTELNIVADQYGSPTSAHFIADSTAHIIVQSVKELKQKEFTSCIYHLVASGHITWHGFASSIINTARKTLSGINIKTNIIQPISTTDYPTPAQRPANSRLSTDALTKRFNIHPSDWHKQMELCLKELDNLESKKDA